ncbi:MAG: transglutaminase domain-containing protein [Lachnospiraceae bacterium]|nr:transglutaminase domain-containing protein [Lachnospiraceae bacterium]
MKQKSSLIRVFLLFFVVASFFVGCGSKPSDTTSLPDTKRITNHTFLQTEAAGTTVFENESVILDASNASHGYIMANYQGSSAESRLQITIPDKTVYTYVLSPGNYETIPLTGANGDYQINILEHVSDDMYALVFSENISVTLDNDFSPYLYPNQYVWYTPESPTTDLGIVLSDESANDLDYLEKVYHYVITNISYDTNLAQNIPLNYIPDTDSVLEKKSGICFDYASLMCALLRSQNIPTKLVVGYSGTAYHAWISVYLQETGWVDNIIQFDGEHWSLMDPTLAASNDQKDVEKYIGDGSNYLAKYYY